jgi:hypothetical protein
MLKLITYCDALGLVEYVHEVEDGVNSVLESIDCAVSH